MWAFWLAAALPGAFVTCVSLALIKTVDFPYLLPSILLASHHPSQCYLLSIFNQKKNVCIILVEHWVRSFLLHSIVWYFPKSMIPPAPCVTFQCSLSLTIDKTGIVKVLECSHHQDPYWTVHFTIMHHFEIRGLWILNERVNPPQSNMWVSIHSFCSHKLMFAIYTIGPMNFSIHLKDNKGEDSMN